MQLRAVNLMLIGVGAVIMAVSYVRFRQLVKYNRQESYDSEHRSGRVDAFCSASMLLFMAGYLVGFADNLLRVTDSIYTFVLVVYLFGAVFIFVFVSLQQKLAFVLRKKSMETMKTFVNTIDLKDSYTKGHSAHVYRIIELFFDELSPFYGGRISRPKLLDAAMLHDIGKISISDSILNKCGKLDEREWEVIRQHPKKGKLMMDDTCFREISQWVLYHHERVDGRGYYGIPEEDIPLESRVIAIADTYSALCTDRVYRGKKTHREAVAIMKSVAGSQLDAGLLEFFFRIDQKKLEELLAEKDTDDRGETA